MEGRTPAPPKNPWNDDSTVNTNELWFCLHGFKAVQDFVHPQFDLFGVSLFFLATRISTLPGADTEWSYWIAAKQATNF